MSSNLSKKKICSFCGYSNRLKDKFCSKCGKELKDIQEKKFEIIESLKGSLYGSIVCIGCFVFFMILVSVMILIQRPDIFYALFIIWPIIIGFLYWASKYLSGLSKLRRFTITKNYIEIDVPNKILFRINWSDFDILEIKKREHVTWIVSSPGPRFVYYNLIFKGKNFEKSYEFESGKDFKSRTRKNIISKLEDCANKLKKEFIPWKKKKIKSK